MPVKYWSSLLEICTDLGHSYELGVGHSCDLPPPFNPLKSLARNFALSYDLEEGKNSTPVRSVALVRKLANDRAGVEFLTDTGDEGACFFIGPSFASLLVMFVLTTSETLTGWGGSGREGKGYPQSRISMPVATLGFAENKKGVGGPLNSPPEGLA